MVNLSVCIEKFWRRADLPFDERIRRTASLGFDAYEFWGWRNKDLDALERAHEESGMTLAALALEPQFSLVEPGLEAELIEGAAQTAQVAERFGCSGLILTTGDIVADESFSITRRRVVRRLRKMAEIVGEAGKTIFLEPLNPLIDHRGYWLTTMAQANDIVEEVESPALTILYDLYHQQITEGNLIANLVRYLDRIGHIHTAGVPGRHELLGGENDYTALFAAIESSGYAGFVGLEFDPTLEDEEGLKQAQRLALDAEKLL